MIDTLKAVDKLKQHGFDDEKARAIADLVANTNEELATKKDVNTLRWMIGLLYPLVVAMLLVMITQ